MIEFIMEKIKPSMVIKKRARYLRNNTNDFEKKLWYQFLAKSQMGFRWLRQKPIKNYIVDFYCPQLKLAIEVDGITHIDKKAYDKKRSDDLAAMGIAVIRYDNTDVAGDNGFELVKLDIQTHCEKLAKNIFRRKNNRKANN